MVRTAAAAGRYMHSRLFQGVSSLKWIKARGSQVGILRDLIFLCWQGAGGGCGIVCMETAAALSLCTFWPQLFEWFRLLFVLMFHYLCYICVFGVCVLFFANICLRPLVACTITAGTLALSGFWPRCSDFRGTTRDIYHVPLQSWISFAFVGQWNDMLFGALWSLY